MPSLQPAPGEQWQVLPPQGLGTAQPHTQEADEGSLFASPQSPLANHCLT